MATPRRTRCTKGTRWNKNTKKCEPSKHVSKTRKPRCQNGTRRVGDDCVRRSLVLRPRKRPLLVKNRLHDLSTPSLTQYKSAPSTPSLSYKSVPSTSSLSYKSAKNELFDRPETDYETPKSYHPWMKNNDIKQKQS